MSLKILVSNDDGIFALGLQTLVTHLAREHQVWVVAPDRERSATGHALTLHKPLRIDEVQMNAPVVQAYAVTGTPSDCVKIALSTLMPEKPDMVISGINHGPNLGADVLYSGTVSAAIEGGIFGIPSVAVSLINGYSKDADFASSAQFITDYLHRLRDITLPPKTILNVNMPAVPLPDIAGVCVSVLGTRMYTDTYEKRIDPRGHVYYWLAGEIVEQGEAPDSDVEVVRNNMVSVTPVKFDLTHHQAVEDFRSALECRMTHGQLSAPGQMELTP